MPFVGGSGFPQTTDNRTRNQVAVELCEYTGGEDTPEAQTRAAKSWDAATREFNSVPWKFNRVTQDISLTSTMLDNVTALSISRDAGAGAGFVLTSGTKIQYWVEERVKDGNYITKRNNNPAAIITTLVGDGTTDKPVLTRPATVNSDTTHWALFGTRAGGEFPYGSEIDEAAIATTTLEDTRMGNNPAIPDGFPYYVGVYLLQSDFRNPKSAHLVDDAGQERDPVDYVPYDQFLTCLQQEASWSSTYPDVYTVRNAHETGEVTVYPRQTRPVLYPSLRLVYHRRIQLATGNDDRLNVPVEVDEAIFQLAVAKFLSKLREHKQSVLAFQVAKDIRAQIEREWRDWSEHDPT